MANEKRLIDANAFFEEHCADCKYFGVNGICDREDPVCASAMIVAELPTIDAVEVVRCKDCKYWSKEKDLGMFCNHWGSMLTESVADDFCSYGVRKDNGRSTSAE